MSPKKPPHWAALAAAETAEYLQGVWFDGIGKQQAWELTTAAFQETLGWGAGGKAGFKSAAAFWHAVVEKY